MKNIINIGVIYFVGAMLVGCGGGSGGEASASSNGSSVVVGSNSDEPLLGVWYASSGGDIFVFGANHEFTHIKSQTNDKNCKSGTAKGTFSWNPSDLKVTFVIDGEPISQPGNNCATPGTYFLNLNGNMFSVTFGGTLYNFEKKIPPKEPSILGVWSIFDANGTVTFTFNSDNTVMQVRTDNKDSSCKNGTAIGTYSRDSATSVVKITLSKDETLCGISGTNIFSVSASKIIINNNSNITLTKNRP